VEANRQLSREVLAKRLNVTKGSFYSHHGLTDSLFAGQLAGTVSMV